MANPRHPCQGWWTRSPSRCPSAPWFQSPRTQKVDEQCSGVTQWLTLDLTIPMFSHWCFHIDVLSLSLPHSILHQLRNHPRCPLKPLPGSLLARERFSLGPDDHDSLLILIHVTKQILHHSFNVLPYILLYISTDQCIRTSFSALFPAGMLFPVQHTLRLQVNHKSKPAINLSTIDL